VLVSFVSYLSYLSLLSFFLPEMPLIQQTYHHSHEMAIQAATNQLVARITNTLFSIKRWEAKLATAIANDNPALIVRCETALKLRWEILHEARVGLWHLGY